MNVTCLVIVSAAQYIAHRLRSTWPVLILAVAGGLSWAGQFDAQHLEAEELLLQGKENDYASIMQRLGEAGDVQAQISYGQLLWRNGYLVEAEEWLRRAAATGDANAQYRLGAFLLGSTPARPAEATGWLEQAAAQGNTRAIYLLAALKSRLPPPEQVAGQMATDQAADYAFSSFKTMLLSNVSILACYHIGPEDIDRLFGPAARTCKDSAVQEYGARIAGWELLDFSRRMGACIRPLVLLSVKISQRELLECSRRVR